MNISHFIFIPIQICLLRISNKLQDPILFVGFAITVNLVKTIAYLECQFTIIIRTTSNKARTKYRISQCDSFTKLKQRHLIEPTSH